MIITAKKAANAAGGKTARACDSCLRWRARWYCPADDAFLCQGCDSSVHSANQLASRHERVRLETASNKPIHDSTLLTNSQPGWLHGLTRKARTPRHPKPNPVQTSKDDEKTINPLPLVPEIGSEEANSMDENEEEHENLYRVPIFDPFDEKIEDLDGFFSSDMDLAEFAADVEILLGRGIDDDTCGIEGLGFLGCKEEVDVDIDICIEGRGVKVEDEDLEAWDPGCHSDPDLDGARDVFDWNFDCKSPVTIEEEEEEKVVIAPEKAVVERGEERRNVLLRLNYEEVIGAWASQGSPWTTGIKPEFNPEVCWPDFMGTCSIGVNHMYGGKGGRTKDGDGGREARVSRYREKRRTRLFSKKIRYEVRKLNAEKRPRMKGRFVRRTPGFPNYLINK